MAGWAGFDSTDFAYSLPRPIPPGQPYWSCNPNNQGLAVYTANHYANRTPTSKYFCRYFQTGGGFSSFDPAEVASLRTSTFFFILPIAAPAYSRETRNDQIGKDWGGQDATTCLTNIVAVLNGGYGVTAPFTVYVYLDIESGTPISAWFWEGWSETIFNYVDPTWGSPFWPAVYATPSTVVGSTDKATMDMLVGYNNRQDFQHSCYGLWTTQPSYSGSNPTVCNYSKNDLGPTWDLTASPPRPQGYPGLVLHHWQYALDNNFWTAECQTTPPGTTCCDSCRPHVDNDQSDPTREMTANMLRIT